MRSNLICSLLLGLAISVMTGTETLAQATAKSKDTAKAPSAKTSEPAKAAAEFRRVPQYFAQVDLSDDSVRERGSFDTSAAHQLEQAAWRGQGKSIRKVESCG